MEPNEPGVAHYLLDIAMILDIHCRCIQYYYHHDYHRDNYLLDHLNQADIFVELRPNIPYLDSWD